MNIKPVTNEVMEKFNKLDKFDQARITERIDYYLEEKYQKRMVKRKGNIIIINFKGGECHA